LRSVAGNTLADEKRVADVSVRTQLNVLIKECGNVKSKGEDIAKFWKQGERLGRQNKEKNLINGREHQETCSLKHKRIKNNDENLNLIL
jgi:hypothetical protein